jgi:carboxylate-amine ligase
MADSYSFGIEEEYFLVDAATKSLALRRPDDFVAAAKKAIGPQIRHEFQQGQIEVATAPHLDMTRARAELRGLRHALSEVAAEHGLAILAAGTHPTATWEMALQTPGPRYDTVMHDLQMVGQRDLLCGLHVHVELPDPDRRVDVMRRMLPYLPLFIALATSSPFWRSRPTGLMGYRLAAYDELPRTGVPELFRDRAEFDAYIAALTRAGVIQDSSYVWWAIRPSLELPTLELRAPDICTFVDDSIAVAALYRALARRLYRDPSLDAGVDAVSRAIVVENKWRAQRYGVHGTFARESGLGAITVAELTDQVIEEAMPDAEALGCTEEIARCRTIVAAGTSADAQLAVFAKYEKSRDREAALAAVTDWLATATLQ